MVGRRTCKERGAAAAVACGRCVVILRLILVLEKDLHRPESEAGLRAVFRARSREVHPDLNPTAVVDGEEGSGGGVPTVYEVNLAYEAVRKML